MDQYQFDGKFNGTWVCRVSKVLLIKSCGAQQARIAQNVKKPQKRLDEFGPLVDKPQKTGEHVENKKMAQILS